MTSTFYTDWSMEDVERFWRVVYDHDLPPARAERRLAPYLAEAILLRARKRARIVEIGSRSGELAYYLTRVGMLVGRLDTGPCAMPPGLESHPAWLGNIGLDQYRSADMVIGADVMTRLGEDEIAAWFAAARFMIGWTGVLVVSTKNGGSLSDEYAMCPKTAVIFNGAQRRRTLDRQGLQNLIESHGFKVTATIQAELDTKVLSHIGEPPRRALARDDVFIGNGENLLMFAQPDRWADPGDRDIAAEWLDRRRRAAIAASDARAEEMAWSPDAIRKFWNSMSGTPLEDQGFGVQVGLPMLSAVEPWLVPGGRHLDVGAGGGDVAQLLIDAGYPAAAYEAADGRRRAIESKLGGQEGYLGTLTALEGVEPFDVIFLVEVVEHIPEDGDQEFYRMIRSCLKPNGVLVVTTPSAEVLENSMQYSPAGNVVFHRWQHLRSFSAQTLAERLHAHGFLCDVVHDVDFSAVSRGSAPFFERRLATTLPEKIGEGGTLIAIARPRAVAPERKRAIPYLTVTRKFASKLAARIEPADFSLIEAEEVVYAPSPQEHSAKAVKLINLAKEFVRRLEKRARAAEKRLSFKVAAVEQITAPIARVSRKITGEPHLRDAIASFPPDFFRGGPIILVNNALAWGGVERQVVNTLLGLQKRCDLELGLICLKLGEGGDYSFYRPALADFRGIVRDMAPFEVAEQTLRLTMEAKRLADARRIIDWMPTDVQENILRLMADFATLRPAVVHAWQDALSIEAAFAAKLIGVPRIITSARNLSPPNFAYFREHQREAYREIADCDDIVMLANSEAGAADYARWLNLSRNRFGIVRNGIDTSQLKRAAPERVAALRQKLGIPGHVQVIGSIFRFYAEKQPRLWMEVAAETARRISDAHFVIFGVGPEMADCITFAREHGFGDRFHAPGTIEDPSLALSMFDCFLLTSKFEGTPNVVLEAECLGVPVVATPAGGTAEAVDDDVTGWVVNPPDTSVMSNRVCQAVSDAQWRARCATEAPAFCERRFGLNRMIEETIALYEIDLKQQRGRSEDVLHRASECASRA